MYKLLASVREQNRASVLARADFTDKDTRAMFPSFLVTLVAGILCGLAFGVIRREDVAVMVAAVITAGGFVTLLCVGFDPTKWSKLIAVGVIYGSVAFITLTVIGVLKGGQKKSKR